MKSFLTNNFSILLSLLFALLGAYGLSHPVGVTMEVVQGTIIAKDSTDVKIGKNSFERRYRFALKYEDRASDVITVNLAQYTENEVGQNFQRTIRHESTMYKTVSFISLLLTAFGISGVIVLSLFKFFKF